MLLGLDCGAMQVAQVEVSALPEQPMRTQVVVITSDGMLRSWDTCALQEKVHTCIAASQKNVRPVHRGSERSPEQRRARESVRLCSCKHGGCGDACV